MVRNVAATSASIVEAPAAVPSNPTIRHGGERWRGRDTSHVIPLETMALFIPSRLVVTSAIIALLFSHFVSSHDSAAGDAKRANPANTGNARHHSRSRGVRHRKQAPPFPGFRTSARRSSHRQNLLPRSGLRRFLLRRDGQAGDVWQASLPIAAPETRGFLYYIEVVDLSFNTSRTAEFTTKVTGENECDRRDEEHPRS